MTYMQSNLKDQLFYLVNIFFYRKLLIFGSKVNEKRFCENNLKPQEVLV